jgi:NADPH-dependent ferric siderophore reductase
MFPRPGVEVPGDGVELWALPSEQRPVMRTYTVRAIDPIHHQLTIDFVTHGDEGVAGRWAMRAQPGDELIMSGPGGGYAPLLDADLHLLVGDEAAIPAIASALEAMAAGSRAIVLLEVGDAAEHLDLPSPADVDLRWIHRADGAGPDALLAAVEALDLPAERVQAFVHGELHATRAIKRHLVAQGIAADLLSASGYWRRGKDEDGFQAEKRELAQADRAAAGA